MGLYKLMITHYVLIDPFNNLTSGVTTYTNTVAFFLKKRGIKTTVIRKHKNEDLNHFKFRIASEISNYNKVGLFVEAPETLHTTSELDPSISIHIRLHGSRQFGNFLKKQSIDKRELIAEESEIKRAQLVSAPSVSAVEASRLIFDYPEKILFYPNPIPLIGELKKYEKDIDCLFLGRWEMFKGCEFFIKLSEILPNFKFAVASSKQNGKIPNYVQHLLVENEIDRYRIISRSRVVVIPSYFETASMVGLEAFACECPVIVWSHIGLNEYADEPYLYKSEPWSIDEFQKKLQQALSVKKEFSFRTCNEKIQKAFSLGLENILIGNVSFQTSMPFINSSVNWENLFTKKNLTMNSNYFFKTKRKFRKFLRTPSKFFTDSYIYKLITFEKYRINPDIKEFELTHKIDCQEINLFSENVSSPLNVPSNAYLGCLYKAGPIKIRDASAKLKGWVTVFVHNEIDADEVLEIRNKLIKFEDFGPFSDDQLAYILNDTDSNEDVVSIINRIDHKNKERIAAIDNLLTVNANPNILKALKSCGTNNRIILLITREIENIYLNELSQVADAVICFRSHPAASLKWPRISLIDNLNQIPNALRKIVQDFGPKFPDMLLCVIGNSKYYPDLINFDSDTYKGLIRIKKHSIVKVNTFHEYIQHISKNIVELFLVESIYMRYKDMCIEVEAGRSPEFLIETCLKDGVIFDVY